MPSIIIRRDGKSAKELVLEKDLTLVGRKDDADIKIDAPGEQEEWASIMKLGDSYVLNELGPGGAVLVNGQAVKKRVLKDRDLIVIEEYRLTFQDKREPDEAGGIEVEVAQAEQKLKMPRGAAEPVDPFRATPAGKSKLVGILIGALIVGGIAYASYVSYLDKRAADAQAAQVRKAYDDKAKSEAEQMKDNARAVSSSIVK